MNHIPDCLFRPCKGNAFLWSLQTNPSFFGELEADTLRTTDFTDYTFIDAHLWALMDIRVSLLTYNAHECPQMVINIYMCSNYSTSTFACIFSPQRKQRARRCTENYFFLLKGRTHEKPKGFSQSHSAKKVAQPLCVRAFRLLWPSPPHDAKSVPLCSSVLLWKLCVEKNSATSET